MNKPFNQEQCLIQTGNTPVHFEYLVIKLAISYGFTISELEELTIERVNGFYVFPPNCAEYDYIITDNEFDMHTELYDRAIDYLDSLCAMGYAIWPEGTALVVHTVQ